MQLQSALKALLMLLYFLIAAQGAFYLSGMYRVMSAMPADDFVTLRRLANPVLEPRLKLLYLVTLLCLAAALLFPAQPAGAAGYIALAAATVLLIADIVLALKLSMPLNAGIGRVGAGAAAGIFRQQWLQQIYIRSWISVAGFAILLIGGALSTGAAGPVAGALRPVWKKPVAAIETGR